VQAIAFDLPERRQQGLGPHAALWELGWQATQAASSAPFSLGTVGGGYGATTAIFKGGLGSASA